MRQHQSLDFGRGGDLSDFRRWSMARKEMLAQRRRTEFGTQQLVESRQMHHLVHQYVRTARQLDQGIRGRGIA
jgi:hypothetical protein